MNEYEDLIDYLNRPDILEKQTEDIWKYLYNDTSPSGMRAKQDLLEVINASPHIKERYMNATLNPTSQEFKDAEAAAKFRIFKTSDIEPSDIIRMARENNIDPKYTAISLTAEDLLKQSRNAKNLKNIAKNIKGGPLLNAAIATPFIANALFNPAYASNRGEKLYEEATNFISPVGAYEGFQGQGGGLIPAIGGFAFGPDVSTPLKQDALTGAYADRYTRFNLDTPEAKEAYRQTRPKGEY